MFRFFLFQANMDFSNKNSNILAKCFKNVKEKNYNNWKQKIQCKCKELIAIKQNKWSINPVFWCYHFGFVVSSLPFHQFHVTSVERPQPSAAVCASSWGAASSALSAGMTSLGGVVAGLSLLWQRCQRRSQLGSHASHHWALMARARHAH